MKCNYCGKEINEDETYLYFADRNETMCYECGNEESDRLNTKIRVYKITPGKDLNPYIEKEIKIISEWIDNGWGDDADIGDEIKIEVMEMTNGEYETLKEYMGA